MKQDYKLSIIVPIFNAEKFLEQCIKSIVDQSYKNLEIILIDDGSSDASSEICDKWAALDHRIIVLHKENGGGAQARNVGLNIITGDYFGFVDSDDLISPYMYEIMMNCMIEHNCEIVECSYSENMNDILMDHNITGNIIGIFTPEEAMEENIKDKILRQIVWNKLYSKRILHDTRFCEGKFIDDEFFTYQLIGRSKKSVVIDSKLYFYRQQPESAMHQTYSVKWIQAIEAKCNRHDFIEEHFHKLSLLSRISILNTCMYHWQKAIIYINAEERDKIISYLSYVTKKYIIQWKDFPKMSLKQRIWLICFFKFPNTICTLRNLLKIGL